MHHWLADVENVNYNNCNEYITNMLGRPQPALEKITVEESYYYQQLQLNINHTDKEITREDHHQKALLLRQLLTAISWN